MLAFAQWTLRQRRYKRLAALTIVIAVLCIAAGTWQISRLEDNLRINHAVRANADDPATDLTTSLVPLTSAHTAAPSLEAIWFRSVTVSGQYLPGKQQYLQQQSVHGHDGFAVLDPLRTTNGVLLVSRGFVRADQSGGLPRHLPTAPTGPVSIQGRLQPVSTKTDGATELTRHQIVSVNAGEQSTRLGAPVYQAWLKLSGSQPGLTAWPVPDLSNPAGGAVAPQHLAYVIQWYLFALLALAAPFAMARHEVRDARQRWLGIDSDDEQFDLDSGEGDVPLGLPGGTRSLEAAESSGIEPTGQLVARSDGSVVRREEITPAEWARAQRMADRYGRSLGSDTMPTGRRLVRTRAVDPDQLVSDSASAVHRSEDAYHAAYNDYLWQLALADGDQPDTAPPAEDEPTSGPARRAPRIIEGDPGSDGPR